jgi:hypothetical protein
LEERRLGAIFVVMTQQLAIDRSLNMLEEVFGEFSK